MDDDVKGAFTFSGLICLILVCAALIVGSCDGKRYVRQRMQKQAIANGAGRYHPVSGEFGWVSRTYEEKQDDKRD